MKETYRVPVSVKGIVFEEGGVWLRRNERGEWELPGGKLEKGEQPEETVVRELEEELGFAVEVVDIVLASHYIVADSIDEFHGVLVLIYLCKFLNRVSGLELAGEAGEASFKKFRAEEIADLRMPEFYKK